MAPRRPTAAAFLLALASVIAPDPARADEAENSRRLQAMPRERRVALAENLERFDKLDATERAAIRKIDAAIAARDPVDQARYRTVLRRYHLWANGLTDDQKRDLKAAETPEARFALARKFRSKAVPAGGPGPRIAGIRTGNFGLVGPYEAAHMLKVWNKLTPARKAEIEKQQERGRLFAAIRAESRPSGVKFEPFPAADDSSYAARLEGDPSFKPLLGPMVRWPDPTVKKVDPAQKKAENPQRRFEHPLAEFLYFDDHRPRPVAQKDLERFASACPEWLHAMTDPLSPDDARDYLTIIYRLLYPHPSEIPPVPKAAKAPSNPTAGPKPVPKQPTSSDPS